MREVILAAQGRMRRSDVGSGVPARRLSALVPVRIRKASPLQPCLWFQLQLRACTSTPLDSSAAGRQHDVLTTEAVLDLTFSHAS